MIKIDVAKEFTDAPGVRWRTLSDFSGQEFREDFLEKHFVEPSETKIILDFTNVLGYPPSFLEEIFGGLARILNSPKSQWDKDTTKPIKQWDRLTDRAKEIVKNNTDRSKSELKRIEIITDDEMMLKEVAEYIDNGDKW